MFLCVVVRARIHAVVRGRHRAADHAVVRHVTAIVIVSASAVAAENQVQRMHEVARVLHTATTMATSSDDWPIGSHSSMAMSLSPTAVVLISLVCQLSAVATGCSFLCASVATF